MPSTMLLAALKVLVLAGGGEATDNHHSHQVHVDALLDLLAERGVPPADVALFWADGTDPGPDRAVLPEPPPAELWRIEGTRLDTDLALAPLLEDTAFAPGRFAPPVRPAKREALRAYLAGIGPTLGPDDTLLVAVTDHGQPDPAGGNETSISLWGEQWTVSDFAADLAPVPASTRVVLWMSQCFSGGFADLHRTRPNLCGAFAAHPDRPAYGCHPQLAGRPDVGHFLRMVEALARHGDLAAAHDAVLLTDDTPDTPHLTSDVMLFEAIDAAAAARGAPLARFLDERLPTTADDPLWRLLAELAVRYGLGAPRGYGDALAILDGLDAARYALATWREALAEADLHARGLLAEPLIRVLRPARDRSARRAQQRRAIEAMGALIAADPAIEARVRRLRARVEQAAALADRLDVQEAAAIRAAYVITRLAAPAALDPPAKQRYAALRACESAPLWPPAADEAPPLLAPPPLPPVTAAPAEVAALRPGWLGITYRDAPRHQGVIVERFAPGSPALATALAAGDRITAVDGWTLRRRGGFREAALLAEPGATIPLAVRRGKRTEEIPIVAAPMPLPPRPPAIGQPLPALGLTPLDDRRLPPIGEGRRVVLFFWETTCKPCLEAAPALAVWAEAFDAEVLAITGEPAAGVKRFLRRRADAMPFPVALDATGEAARLLAVDRVPVFAVVGPDGVLTDEGEGYVDRVPLREPTD